MGEEVPNCTTATPRRIFESAIGILFLCYVVLCFVEVFFDALGGHVGPFEHQWVPKASIWGAKRCRKKY